MQGRATTSFIERNADALFRVDNESSMGQKLMHYLGEMVVNGPNHPGAVGAPSSRNDPVVPTYPHLEDKPLAGWRDVIVAEGPSGWAKKVRRGLQYCGPLTPQVCANVQRSSSSCDEI